MKRLSLIGLVVVLAGENLVSAAAVIKPQTLFELNQWYAEPAAAQNAAALYLMGFTAMQISSADYPSTNLPTIGLARMPEGNEPLPPEMLAAISELIDNNRVAIRFFTRAAELQQARYPIDLTRGPTTLLPHLSKIKSAGQVLELYVILQADTDNAELAVEGILTSLALAQSLELEPTILSQLVRVACINFTASGLEQTLNRTPLQLKYLNRLGQVFESCEKRDTSGVGFTRAWIGERLSGLSWYDKFNQHPGGYLKIPDNASATESEAFTRQIKETLTSDRQLFQSTFAKIDAMRSSPFPLRLEQDEVFRQAALQATNLNLLLSCMLLPGLDGAASREAVCLARLRQSQTAIALEKFRMAHNDQYPKALTELTPDFLKVTPSDPFDGKELRYRKEGNGYLLYSIGADLRDDNGKPIKVHKGDLVFRISSPQKPKP